MPRHHKPSTWQAFAIGKPPDPLVTDEAWLHVLARVGISPRRAKACEAFKAAITDALLRLGLDLHDGRRPTDAQVRAELKRIEKALAHLFGKPEADGLVAIDRVSDFAKALLADAACGGRASAAQGRRPHPGLAMVAPLISGLVHLHRLIRIALDSMPPPRRRANLAYRNYAEAVRDAWKAATGREPTLTPFLEVLRATAGRSIQARRGDVRSLDRAARRALYG